MCLFSKIILLLFQLTVFSIFSQEKDTKLFLRGYIKNLHEFSFVDQLEQIQWTTFLHNRLNFKYTPSETITARLEFRNRFFYGDNIKNIPAFSDVISRDNGWINLSWNLIDNSSVIFNATIDRALVNYNEDNWDITLGRQRVNWGRNLVWNPNDIFNTYNFLDFDYEERPGSDALRLQYYTSDFSKIELAAKMGRDDNDYIIATMYQFNTWSYDIQVLTGIYQKDWVIGAGWAGNLKNTGFKGEISYFIPYERSDETENVLSTSISVDYGFKNGIYINGSVLYNSSSDDFLRSVENLLFADITAKNLMPFEYSGFLQLSKDFSPIFSASVSAIYSPTNHSAILIPFFKYSLATNWEIDFTGQSFFEFDEYQTLGNSFYGRLRWSF
ncbi:hypothetical protein [Aquimarina celericrescens]|uniref:Porin n=1 Tax=Aquimarina celericrescens TaxID=1964542 RepID=A0ABW5AT96_9FLAO|nr:hypothetical protein [Aquimarina celericrescens]